MSQLVYCCQNNSLSGETFLPVKDFEDRFFISTHGRIISHDLRKNTISILRPHLDSQGYYQATLRKKPAKRKVRVHTLVGESFLIKPVSKDRITVNHKDGNKLNNHVDNLEWITAKDNCLHAVQSGLHNLKGHLHPSAKLTENQVIKMRSLAQIGVNNTVLGKFFGVSREQARDIVNRKGWTHV